MHFTYAPRLPTFDYTGCHRYFLTICTFDRMKAFADDAVAGHVVAQLSQTATARRFSVIAYCLMPDHLHALAAGDHPAADFREFVRVFKQTTSFDWKRTHQHSLWQRGFFDHVLRDEEDSLGVARYIIENPVRAGLVANPVDYRYLGSLIVPVQDLLSSVQIGGHDKRT